MVVVCVKIYLFVKVEEVNMSIRVFKLSNVILVIMMLFGVREGVND